MTAIRDTAHRESVDVTRSGRRPRVLMVVANPTTSSTTGWPVGSWAAELFTRLRRQGLAGSTPAEIEGRAHVPDEEISMSPTEDTQKSAKRTAASVKKSNGFTDEERAAMKERSQELKARARRGRRGTNGKADGEAEVLAKIAEMGASDRAIAKRVHALIKDSAPELSPRTWYGMPAYAKDGKVVCFFQSAEKFKSRYATFGFNDSANLDEGAMWPTSFALKELTPGAGKRIAALVKQAVS